MNALPVICEWSQHIYHGDNRSLKLGGNFSSHYNLIQTSAPHYTHFTLPRLTINRATFSPTCFRLRPVPAFFIPHLQEQPLLSSRGQSPACLQRSGCTRRRQGLQAQHERRMRKRAAVQTRAEPSSPAQGKSGTTRVRALLPAAHGKPLLRNSVDKPRWQEMIKTWSWTPCSIAMELSLKAHKAKSFWIFGS